MSIWSALWLALAVLVGLVWLIRLATLLRVLHKRQLLHSRSYPGPPDPAPKVTILVAAKDEEQHIETCVESLLAQDYPKLEVVVADDRSHDRTPQILRRLADRAHGRLHVVTVATLPEGWLGKNHAMHAAAAVATGEWLLFTDADCRQTSTASLSMAMREALAEEVDFLCVTPVLDAPSLWERITQPVCTMVLMAWFLPHRVNKPNRKTAYANGAFMLMRRSCYESIGGHERVRMEFNEDIQMARLTKQMGLRLRVVENGDLYRTRMYDSLRAAWRGWSRIFFGSLGSLTRLAASATTLIFVSILPWASLVVALLGSLAWENASPWWGKLLGAWLAVVLLEFLVVTAIYVILRVSPAWAVMYPVGASFVFGMLINAIFKAVGATGTTWRGTSYGPRQAAGSSVRRSVVCPAPRE